MKSKVYYYLSRDTKMPVRGTSKAAGIDFFMPNYNEEFEKDLRAKNINAALEYEHVTNPKDGTTQLMVIIPPHERINVPSGVHTYMIPQESALIAANKSGVSTKKGLVYTCQVIDSDYTGEIHLGLVNTSNESVIITTGDKLVQFIHTPVYFSELEACSDKKMFDELHTGSQRGDGAFGSTDKNNI